MDKNFGKENYKPENPVRTFWGVNRKQLTLKLFYLVAVILTLIAFAFGQLYVGLGIQFLFVVIGTAYRIIYRKKFIADYQQIKIGNIPLSPLESIDFSMRDSLIIILLMIATVAIIFFIVGFD